MTSRFINADGLVYTGQDIFSQNMFAYCENNPVNRQDPTGHSFFALINWAKKMQKQYEKLNERKCQKTIDTKSPPPSNTGYIPPKNSDKAKKKVEAPGARGERGWTDKSGNVWVPDNSMDGGPGWRRHYPDGSHDHVYPGGKIRSHISYLLPPNISLWDSPVSWDTNSQVSFSFSDEISEMTGLTGAGLLIYMIVSEGSRIIPARNLIPVP